MSGGHTPGPWHLRFAGDWLEGVQGSPDAGERFGEMVVNRGIAKPKSDRGMANARLIAAAPDMLEALIAAESLFNHTFAMNGTVHKQIRAAIARTKTGEPA